MRLMQAINHVRLMTHKKLETMGFITTTYASPPTVETSKLSV